MVAPMMFHENRLGKDRAQTSGADDAEKRGDQMDEKNNQIAHFGMLARGEDGLTLAQFNNSPPTS
jgi:hypothetical protein